MSTKPYVREGAAFTEDSSGGQLTEVYDVDVKNVAARDILLTAADSREAPRVGDVHPRRPELIVSSRNFAEIAPERVRITCTFSPPSAGDSVPKPGRVTDVRYEATTIEEPVSQDRFGKTLKTYYGAFRANIIRPVTTVEVDRTERRPPSPNLINNVVGRVNAYPWSGYGARTWLMFSPRSRINADGKTYTLTYRFAYRRESFDHVIESTELIFVEKPTSPPSPFTAVPTVPFLKDVRQVTHVFEIYDVADFNQLGFKI